MSTLLCALQAEKANVAAAEASSSAPASSIPSFEVQTSKSPAISLPAPEDPYQDVGVIESDPTSRRQTRKSSKSKRGKWPRVAEVDLEDEEEEPFSRRPRGVSVSNTIEKGVV